MKPTQKETRLFVDEIDGEVARVIVNGDVTTLPTGLLPEPAREGSWVRLLAEIIPAPPDDAESLRRKLGRGDPGGDIKL